DRSRRPWIRRSSGSGQRRCKDGRRCNRRRRRGRYRNRRRHDRRRFRRRRDLMRGDIALHYVARRRLSLPLGLGLPLGLLPLGLALALSQESPRGGTLEPSGPSALRRRSLAAANIEYLIHGIRGLGIVVGLGI